MFKSKKKHIYFVGLVLLFFLFFSCSSTVKKYGFSAIYTVPFQNGGTYIDPKNDAKAITFLLREYKGINPHIIVRFTTGAFGTWFDLDYVKLTLDNGKSFTFSKGLYKRWGTPTTTKQWTTTTSSNIVEQSYPMVIIDNKPSQDGQVYTWIVSKGRNPYNGFYIYQINTGIYHYQVSSSNTYESLFVESLSDVELKMIAESQTVSLEFYSKNSSTSPQIIKDIYNAPLIKQAVYNYYINYGLSRNNK